MNSRTAAWLANVRAQAADPRTVVVTISGPLGMVAIPPHELVGIPDDEMLAFIVARLSENER